MSRLGELLTSKGISVNQLSSLTGITIERLEQIANPNIECRVTLSTAREIVRALGARVTVAQVFAPHEITSDEARIGKFCDVCHMALPLKGGACENSHRRMAA
jgi:transcriptional regulator with XRE-family HTH domain